MSYHDRNTERNRNTVMERNSGRLKVSEDMKRTTKDTHCTTAMKSLTAVQSWNWKAHFFFFFFV